MQKVHDSLIDQHSNIHVVYRIQKLFLMALNKQLFFRYSCVHYSSSAFSRFFNYTAPSLAPCAFIKLSRYILLSVCFIVVHMRMILHCIDWNGMGVKVLENTITVRTQQKCNNSKELIWKTIQIFNICCGRNVAVSFVCWLVVVIWCYIFFRCIIPRAYQPKKWKIVISSLDKLQSQQCIKYVQKFSPFSSHIEIHGARQVSKGGMVIGEESITTRIQYSAIQHSKKKQFNAIAVITSENKR